MRKSYSPAVALGVAMLVLLTSALPAMAGSMQRRVGNYGYYVPWDQPGVVARYSEATGALRTLRVRAPQKVYGRYADPQTIGWQFKVVYVPDPAFDAQYSAWKVIYRSGIWKDEASKTVIGDFDGKWRTWYAPHDLPVGGYGIFFRIFWYQAGTTDVVEGWTQDDYQRFKLNDGTASYFRWYWCGNTYDGPV